MNIKKETLKYLKCYRSYLVAKERFEKYEKASYRAKMAKMLIQKDCIVQVRYNKKIISGKIVGHIKDFRDSFCLESDELDCQEKEYPVLEMGKTYRAKRKYVLFSNIVSYSLGDEIYNLPTEEPEKYSPFHFQFQYIDKEFQKYLEKEFQTKETIDSGLKELSPFKPECTDTKREQAVWSFDNYGNYGVIDFMVVEFYYRRKATVGLTVSTLNHHNHFRVYSPDFVGRKNKVKVVPKAFFIRVIEDENLRNKLSESYRKDFH